jgi:hypothetical protein
LIKAAKVADVKREFYKRWVTGDEGEADKRKQANARLQAFKRGMSDATSAGFHSETDNNDCEWVWRLGQMGAEPSASADSPDDDDMAEAA